MFISKNKLKREISKVKKKILKLDLGKNNKNLN